MNSDFKRRSIRIISFRFSCPRYFFLLLFSIILYIFPFKLDGTSCATYLVFDKLSFRSISPQQQSTDTFDIDYQHKTTIFNAFQMLKTSLLRTFNIFKTCQKMLKKYFVCQDSLHIKQKYIMSINTKKKYSKNFTDLLKIFKRVINISINLFCHDNVC